MVDHDSLEGLYGAANELQKHHQQSITQLQDLTASLGLLHIDLPVSLTVVEKEFIKKLILLHAVKRTLWNRVQRVHDELNPVRESATRTGQARSLGEYTEL